MMVRTVTSAFVALALAIPASAGQGGILPPLPISPLPKSIPPSQTIFANPPPTGAATPIALVDDASVLPAGSVAASMSTTIWQGTDLREVLWPVADVAVGLMPRFQVSASVPRVVDNTDAGGSAGGLGPMFVSGKIALMDTTGFDGSGVKLAVGPALQILGPSAAASLGPGENRTRWGLPLSAEVDGGRARVFGSAGYFSGGVWFAGAGIGGQALSRLGLIVSASHAWTANADPALIRRRTEVAGGAAILATSSISIFGAISRTIATADENGAGTTVSAGISFLRLAR